MSLFLIWSSIFKQGYTLGAGGEGSVDISVPVCGKNDRMLEVLATLSFRFETTLFYVCAKGWGRGWLENYVLINQLY